MKEIDFGGCSTGKNQGGRDCEPVGVEADFRLANILYQVWGQSKVYEAVIEGKIDHDRWAYCEHCDCASPFLYDERFGCPMCAEANIEIRDEGGGCLMCLVCGSNFDDDAQQNTESENYPIKERKVE